LHPFSRFIIVSHSVIEFRSVYKSYSIYENPSDRLKELVTLQRRSYHRDYWALTDLSFDIQRGETFCVIGENGAGKSTLLQLVAGIIEPSAGEVSVKGRISALLELGAGFNPEFTGRDNVYLNGSILGFSTSEMDARYSRIEQFAEIGDFINQPVKTYSSGMAIRLAFSVAIHVDPDILLVDEALAVGDIYFRQRCMRKVHELRENGTTILFVSHAMPDVKSLGDRALWLEQGKLRELGPPAPVISKYLAAMTAKDSAYLDSRPPQQHPGRDSVERPPEVIDNIPNIDHRHGDRRAEVIGIAVFDETGNSSTILEPESPIIVRISVRAIESLGRPNVGFMMRNHLGVDFAGSNTSRDGYELPPMEPGDVITVDFHLQLPILYPGHFSFSPAIADGSLNDYKMCDWIDNAITLQMGHATGPVYGFMHLPCRVEINRRLTDTLAPRGAAID
jgi:ABC-type polysaccharide/polyol phosphate transport system ATPase subunit